MYGKPKPVLASAVLLAALAAGPGLYAHAEGGKTESAQKGMMGQDGMMGMMQQMNEMMSACTKMMETMAQHDTPAAPKEGEAPEKNG